MLGVAAIMLMVGKSLFLLEHQQYAGYYALCLLLAHDLFCDYYRLQLVLSPTNL